MSGVRDSCNAADQQTNTGYHSLNLQTKLKINTSIFVLDLHCSVLGIKNQKVQGRMGGSKVKID